MMEAFAQAAGTDPMSGMLGQRFTTLFGTTDSILALAFSIIVIIIFARDRYDKATYAASDGPISLIAPRFLTTDARYAAGLRSYIIMMLGVFALLMISGEKLIELMIPGLKGASAGNPWFPLVVALTIVGVSASSDLGPFGSIERQIRRFAHQSAYIPDGTQALANRVSRDQLGTWQLPAGVVSTDRLKHDLAVPVATDPAKSTDIPAYSDAVRGFLLILDNYRSLLQLEETKYVSYDTVQRKSKFEIANNTNNNENNYSSLVKDIDDFRRKFFDFELFKCLYALIRLRMALDEAFDDGFFPLDFVTETASLREQQIAQYESLITSLKNFTPQNSRQTPANGGDLSTLQRKAVALRQQMAVLLAGGLMRARPSDRQVAAILTRVGLEDDGIVLQSAWRSSFSVFLMIFSMLSLFFLILSSYVTVSLINYFIDIKEYYLSEVPQALLSGFLNAIVLYGSVYLIGKEIRERLIDGGEWSETGVMKAKAMAMTVVWSTLIGSTASLSFTVSGNLTGSAVISILATNATLATLASYMMFRSFDQVASEQMRMSNDSVDEAFFQHRSIDTVFGLCWGPALLHAVLAGFTVLTFTYYFTVASKIGDLASTVRGAQISLSAAQGSKAMPSGESQSGEAVLDDWLRENIKNYLDERTRSSADDKMRRLSIELDRWQYAQRTVFDSSNFSRLKDIYNNYFDVIVCKKAHSDNNEGNIVSDKSSCVEKSKEIFQEKGGPNQDSKLKSNSDPSKAVSEEKRFTISRFQFQEFQNYLEKINRIENDFHRYLHLELKMKSSERLFYFGSGLEMISGAITIMMALAAGVLGAAFSFMVTWIRVHEFDEFYGSMSQVGIRRLHRRLIEAKYLEQVDNSCSEEFKKRVFRYSLAKRQPDLLGMSIQEAMMYDGSFTDLQDKLWRRMVDNPKSGIKPTQLQLPPPIGSSSS